MKEEIIPFFEENPRPEYVYRYAKHLASLYEKKQQHAKAVQYYKKAMKALESLKQH
ncbi:hypothetical protein [Alteribacter aurantiacus]|uniref:hypothetical protein n=1 Tax=Alteribacter aurantiacus TaxID=254410 RepID=UPI00042594C6|nr:hypothetical protein [Alteribacter aurantiacus]